jgi:hypothetical protein
VISTLVVCGGLPLLIHAAGASAADPLSSSMASACFFLADGGDQPVFVNSATINDPDDSDDDGDDDAPGGDAAIVIDVHHQTSFALLEEQIHVPVPIWMSRTQDGHALRGPPSGDDDNSLSDDEDDDDDDDSDDSDQLKSLRTAAAPLDGGCRSHVLASQTACASNSATPGHALRAPPARAL